MKDREANGMKAEKCPANLTTRRGRSLADGARRILDPRAASSHKRVPCERGEDLRMFRVAGPVLGSSRVDLGKSVLRRGLRVVPPAAHKVRVTD